MNPCKLVYMRLSVCVFTAMCIALGVQAQTPAVTWIKKNGPIGGQIHDIEVDPATGKVYLLDSNQDPYVSSDNGNTWQLKWRIRYLGASK